MPGVPPKASPDVYGMDWSVTIRGSDLRFTATVSLGAREPDVTSRDRRRTTSGVLAMRVTGDNYVRPYKGAELATCYQNILE